MKEINRRQWIAQTSALAAAGTAFGPESPAQSGAKSWYDRPMRWAQLAFVEDDPGRYDPGFWLDYFKRIHADAACLSAGGCVAFYPTKVPLHYRSKFLGNGDTFGEMLAGCRKLGMNVIARVDPHAAHQDVYDAHPDWIAVQADGQPRRHWAMPTSWVTCALGPYNFEFMTSVIQEIMDLYKVDGIFANRWSGSGMCYCQHCRQNFQAFSGMELPRPEDQGEARRQYNAWHRNRLLELYRLWDGEIRKRNPDAAFFPNGFDQIRDEAHVPILFADRQARSGYTLPWQNGRNAKDARATMGAKPIVGLFSVGLEAPYRWKDSVQNPNEIRAWAVDGIAQGFRPWVIKFNAKPLDHRWFKPVEDLFVWHWKNERYLLNERPLARVGLVPAPRESADYASGFYHALVEARIPFETVLDTQFDSERARQLKVLALPNIVNLSDAQCEQLKAFVEKGGGLVATHETSLNDERGRRRGDFGLAGLFGASFAGNVIERQQNAYLNLEDHSHPLLAGLEDAGRMIHGVKRVEIRVPAGPARAADDRTHVSRSADGGGVRPRSEDRHSRRDAPYRGCRARGLLPLGYRPDLLGSDEPGSRDRSGERGAMGRERGAAAARGRAGSARCRALETAVLRDRAPGQPVQPDDDERTVPRDPAGRAAEGPRATARRRQGARRPVPGQRSQGAVAPERNVGRDHDPADRPARSGGDRPVGRAATAACAARGITRGTW